MIEIRKHKDRGYVLKTSQLVRRDIEEVFAFFSDAYQLERITPPFINIKNLTPRPIELKKGTLIDYSLRLRFLPMKWTTEICDWEPPFRFVDRQLRGPYKQWLHEQVFESVPEGTLVHDRVHYVVPGGELIHRLIVKNDVLNIFRYRQQRLDELLNQASDMYQLGSLAANSV